ncbi:MAG TPA: hypothetical protein VGH84_04315 [Steroidobacteraceae bacterium]
MVDYQKAQSIAAQDPQAAMGMATNLQNASNIRGQQISQGVARNTAVNNAIIGALNGDDAGLHDRVVNGFNGLVANGVMTQDEATRSALRLPADPTQLRGQLQQIQTSLAPPDLQQQQIYGKPFTGTAPGGATIGGTTNIRTGVPTAPPQPGVLQGMTPAEAAQPVTWTDKNNVMQHTTLQEYGAAINSGNARGPAYDANGRPVQGTGGTGAGSGGSSTAPPPPPAHSQIRSPGAYQPPGSNATPPPAAAPAPAATATPATPQPASLSGPTSATLAQQQQDQALYGQDTAQMGAMNKRSIAGKAALDALELARSGPGTGGFARAYAFAQAQGIPLPNVSDPNAYSSQAAWQVLAKNLLRFAQDSSKGSNTDLGLETQLHSNANAEDMLPAANRHVVIQDMGVLRQQMAMVKGQDSSGTGYRDRTKNFPTDTDRNAFAWDLMTPSERQNYYESIKKNPAALAKWNKSMQIAKDTGVWSSQP